MRLNKLLYIALAFLLASCSGYKKENEIKYTAEDCTKAVSSGKSEEIIGKCKELAKNGDKDAQYNLGKLYYYGFEVINNPIDPEKELLEISDKGRSYRDDRLFILSANKKNIIRKQPEEALLFLEKAAKQNHAKALGELANIYLRDAALFFSGIYAKDYGKEDIYLAATPPGDEAAFDFKISELKGTPKTPYDRDQLYIKIFDYARRAAEQGDGKGEYILGMLYRYGKGTPHNPQKAEDYFGRAAWRGNSFAQYQLALMYYDEQKPFEAFSMLEKSSKHRNLLGKLMLARLYQDNKNHKKALKLYREIARKNPENMKNQYFVDYNPAGMAGFADLPAYVKAEANFQIGNIYYNGLAGRKDFNQAYEYFKAAVGEGEASVRHNPALYYLGLMNLKGLGTDKVNERAAMDYFKQASDEEAYKNLITNMTIIYTGDNQESREFYKDKLALAQYGVGMMLLDGIGSYKNEEEAVIWLEKAENNGNKEATKILGGTPEAS